MIKGNNVTKIYVLLAGFSTIVTGFLVTVLFFGGIVMDGMLGYEIYLMNKYNMYYNITTGYCFSRELGVDVDVYDPRCASLRKWNLGWGLLGFGVLWIFAVMILVALIALNLLFDYLQYKKTNEFRFLKINILFLFLGLIPFLFFLLLLKLEVLLI